MKRIAYLSMRRTWKNSIASRLSQQAWVSRDMPIDFYWATPDERVLESSPPLIPLKMKSAHYPYWRIEQFRLLQKLLENYSAVVLRYTTFDPILALMLKNDNRIIWEHHTMEIGELALTSKFRSLLERTFRKWMFRKSMGYAAVSPDVVEELSSAYPHQNPGRTITNSVDFDSIKLSVDGPVWDQGGPIEMIYATPKFSPWSGANEMIHSMEKLPEGNALLHLVGEMEPELRKRVDASPNLVAHGFLARSQVAKLYERCHLGLAHFGVNRIGLKFGAPIKVREYFAAGLPVYGSIPESGVPSDFPYFTCTPKFSGQEGIDFIKGIAKTHRKQIRKLARPYLHAEYASISLMEFVDQCLQARFQRQSSTFKPGKML